MEGGIHIASPVTNSASLQCKRLHSNSPLESIVQKDRKELCSQSEEYVNCLKLQGRVYIISRFANKCVYLLLRDEIPYGHLSVCKELNYFAFYNSTYEYYIYNICPHPLTHSPFPPSFTVKWSSVYILGKAWCQEIWWVRNGGVGEFSMQGKSLCLLLLSIYSSKICLICSWKKWFDPHHFEK